MYSSVVSGIIGCMGYAKSLLLFDFWQLSPLGGGMRGQMRSVFHSL